MPYPRSSHPKKPSMWEMGKIYPMLRFAATYARRHDYVSLMRMLQDLTSLTERCIVAQRAEKETKEE